MGVLCGCQAKATLPTLKGHEAGQKAESDVHVIAKVVVHVVCYSPEPVGQLLGFNCVKFSLVPLQALQLPVGRKEGIKQLSRSLSRKLGCCRLPWTQRLFLKPWHKPQTLTVVVTRTASTSGRQPASSNMPGLALAQLTQCCTRQRPKR